MQKNESLKKLTKIIVFLLIAAVLFLSASCILERKTFYGSWNYMSKLNEFYNMEEDSLNYIGVGSSHMYCTLNPLEVWRDSGIPGFLLATQQQPLTASYYYLKEAFKTQSPDIVFVEGYMGCFDSEFPSEEVAYDAIDPLRFSWNKMQLINHIVPYEKWPNYYFNIIKYHTRWKEIKWQDVESAFNEPIDTYKGYVCIKGKEAYSISESNYDSVQEESLSLKNKKALEKIYDLITEHGAKMVLLIAPYEPIYAPIIKSEIAWAEDKGIDMIDITTLYNELGIDGNEDFYDDTHFDADGAKKVSYYISQYLQSQSIAANPKIDTEKWDSDYGDYEIYLDYLEMQS